MIGRQEESSAVLDLIDGGARFIVLIGPGGVGKTRLATELARSLQARFPDGVWFIPLASIDDPRLVLPTIARSLGLWEASRQPVASRLHRMLGERQVLLVLDNLEQIAEAAPAFVELLASCPRVTILATSRTVLHVSGEHDVHVSTLMLNPTGSEHSEAVLLFSQRARAADSAFAVDASNRRDVDEICRRLDGLPLAIELAAARIAYLSPASLLRRLDHRLPVLTGGVRDAPSRLQTMRGAIAWSYELLTPDLQTVFRQMSVFVGGAFPESVRHVVSTVDDASEWAVIDLLSDLADHSLIYRLDAANGEPRFHQLETIREFGLEQLATEGEDSATRRRHADWCLAFARDIDRTYIHQHDARWRDQLLAESANIREALRWLSDTGDVQTYLALCSALFPLWYYLGQSREGVEWLQAGLESADAVDPHVVLAATIVAAELVGEQCNHPRAIELASEAERIARSLDDHASLADALYLVGKNAQLSGDVSAGRARIEAALKIYTSLGDEIKTAHAHTYLAMLGSGEGAHGLKNAGQLAIARQCWETELRLFGANDDMIGTTRALHGLAYVAYLAGDLERSLALSHESLRLRWEMGDMRALAAQFEDVADIAIALDTFELAARLYAAASILRERTDSPVPWWYQQEYEREIERIRGAMSPSRFNAAWRAGRSMAANRAMEEALALQVSPNPSGRGPESPEHHAFGLTNREFEVLRLIVEGQSNPEIATTLAISQKTVANHVSNIFAKLDVDTRTAAVALAIRMDLA